MLFFWTFYLTKNSENVSWLSHKYETAVFNIDNNQHIRMISERSCDTEDWIQHCITGINYILQYIQIEHRFSHQINAAFVSIRYFKQLQLFWNILNKIFKWICNIHFSFQSETLCLIILYFVPNYEFIMP